MDSTARRVQSLGFLTTAILVASMLLCSGSARANSIAAADLEIQGVSLRVVDTAVTTGVDIPVSIQTEFAGKRNDGAPLLEGIVAVGDLSGPSLTNPIQLQTLPGHAFQVPPLPTEGLYFLQNVRMMRDNEFLQAATPSFATIAVTNVLGTSVRIRQLTLEEVRARGIVLDGDNYAVYEYTFSFLVDGQLVEIPFPVIVDLSNREPFPVVRETPFILPPLNTPSPPRWTPPRVIAVELYEAGPPIPTPAGEPPGSARPIRSIPAAIVIPNEFAVLHQFFSVELLLTNSAPAGSGVRLHNLEATLRTPADLRIVSSTPASSSGRPLSILDSENGSAVLDPQRQGDAEWTLEGLRAGTHAIEIEITATLRSPGQADVPLRGIARAAVQVHDPRFNISFSHPATVRSGIEYSTFSFITNLTPVAQTINVSSGVPSCATSPSANVCLVDGAPPTHELTIPSGGMRTIEYRLRAGTTGSVFATAGSVDGSEISAAVALHMGVSATGVPLSPATLVLPFYAGFLDDALVSAKLEMLGLAWSAATAPLNQTTAQFPRVTRAEVFRRGQDVALAGQRLFISKDPLDTYGGLALDFLGNATELREFDQLRREEASGRRAGAAVMEQFIAAGLAESAVENFFTRFAAGTAHRTPFIAVALHGPASAEARPYALSLRGVTSNRLLDVPNEAAGGWVRQLPFADLSRFVEEESSRQGELALVGRWTEDVLLRITATVGGPLSLDVIYPTETDGTLLRAHLEFTATAGETYQLTLTRGGELLQLTAESGVAVATATATVVDPQPLQIVAARQDLFLDPGGRIVSVLYNRPATAGAGGLSYDAEVTFDHDGISYQGPRPIFGSRLQDEGRVTNVTFAHSLSKNVPDSGGQYLLRSGPLVDPLTTAPVSFPAPVTPGIENDAPAGILFGRVLEGTSAPVPGADVRLTSGGTQFDVTNADGVFFFESVPRDPDAGMSGAYTLEAFANGKRTSVTGAVRLPGRVHRVDLLFLGRGRAEGVVRYQDGTAVSGARVIVGSTTFSLVRQTVAESSGAYVVDDLPVGPLTFSAIDAAGNAVFASAELKTAGALIRQDLTIQRNGFARAGSVRGTVRRSDTGAPVAGARVGVFNSGHAVGETFTAGDGRFDFPLVPAGFVTVQAAEWNLSRESSIINFDLGADQTREVTLTLNVDPAAPSAALEGQVFIEDALFPGDVSKYRNASGAIVSIQGGESAVADADGRFAFPSIPVTFSGRQVTALDPSSQRAGGGVVPALNPSAANHLPIVIRGTYGTGQVRVRLLSATGVPVSGYRVIEPGFPPIELAETAPGTYELTGIAVGRSLEIRAVPASPGAYGDQFASGNVRVDFAGQIAALTLRLPGQGTVRVKLRSDIDLIGDVTMRYAVWDEAEQQIGSREIVRSTSEGGIAGFATFDAVPALGDFTVSSSHPLHGHSARSGKLAYQGDLAEITLQLDRLSSIRGVVYGIDGVTPIPGASVRLEDGRQDQGATLTTLDGSFEFFNVPANTPYRVIAEVTQGTVFRTGIAGGVTPEGGAAIAGVAVVLRRQGRVEGRVVYLGLKSDPANPGQFIPDDTPDNLADNAPVPLARFYLKELDFPSRSFGTVTETRGADAAGRFSVSNVFEGPFRVSAFDPSDPELRGNVLSAISVEGEEAIVIIAIGTGGIGSIAATVTDPNDAGAPVPLADVTLYRDGKIFDLTTSDASGVARFADVPAGDYAASAYAQLLGRSGSAGGIIVSALTETNVTIPLELSGGVDGMLTDPEKGDAGVPATQVTLTAPNFVTRTTTGPDGAFTFDGIREGPFTLSVVQPQTGRRATGVGSVTAATPRPFVPLQLEPTERLHLEVYLPNDSGAMSGVLTPPVRATVRQFCAGCLQERNAEGNPLAFDGVLEREDYHIEVEEIGGERRRVAFIGRFPVGASISPVRLVLPAFGRVEVLLTQNGTPLANARVTISGGGRTAVVFTAPSGVAVAEGIPLGSISVQAVSLDGLLSASASASLVSQSTPATLTLALGSYAGITGLVEAEAGGPSIGTRVIASFTGVTLESRTDSSGRYTFNGIPVPPAGTVVDLLYIGPDDTTSGGSQRVTIPAASGTAVVEVPAVKLDSTPPRLLSVSPADGATDVPPDSSITLVFSEPIRAEHIANSHIQLIPSDGSPQVLPIFTDSILANGTHAITMTPPAPPAGQQFPLKSHLLYRVIVSGSITDRSGHPLPSPFGSAFTTSDYIEPRVVQVIPSPTLPLQPSTTFRFHFSEPVDPAPWQPGGSGAIHLYKLTAFGAEGEIAREIPGNASLDQGNTVLVHGPLELLESESFYRIVFSGIRDLQGNALAQQTFHFFSRDDTPPFVILSSPLPDGFPLISGVEYVLVPDLRNGGADGTAAVDIARVDYFRVEGASAVHQFTADAVPFSYRFTAPEAPEGGTTLSIRAVALDLSTNQSAPAEIALAVQPNDPPENVALALSPAGLVFGGTMVTGAVTFEDEGLVVSVQLAAEGLFANDAPYEASVALERERSGVDQPWPPASLPIVLPATLKGGSTVAFTATVTDSLGQQATATGSIELLNDIEAPQITITSPEAGQLFTEGTGATIPVRATVTDAGVGVNIVTLRVDGGAPVPMTLAGGVYSADVPIGSLEGTEPVDRTFTISASDHAGNESDASVTVLVQALNDPNAPVVRMTCSTSGAMYPAGWNARIRFHAIGNAGGNPANGIDKLEIFVGDAETPIIPIAVPGMADEYEALVPMPSLPDGSIVSVRVVVTNVSGESRTATSDVTIVEGRVIVGDTIIFPDDTGYENETVIVQSGVLTVIGPHTFERLVVLGGSVTHAQITATEMYRLELTTGSVYVACNAALDASGKGYGVTSNGRAMTWPGVFDGGSVAGAGGSHGGTGGASTSRTYGSIFFPDTPGAAGGHTADCASCYQGGGVISIEAENMLLDGDLLANGRDSDRGAGAGGSILLVVGELRGPGELAARGGTGWRASGSNFEGAGGGGGRIAIYYDAVTLPPGNISASGGSGYNHDWRVGAPGTVYLKRNSETLGALIVANDFQSPNATPLPMIGERVVDARSVDSITSTGADFSGPDHLRGMLVAINGDLDVTWPVLENDADTITVDVSSAPLTAEIGDTFRGLYRFSGLKLRNAQAVVSDHLQLDTEVDKDDFSAIFGANLGEPSIDLDAIVVTTGGGAITVTGAAGAVSDPDQPVQITVRNNRGGATWSTVAGPDGAFSRAIQGEGGDVISLRARDTHPLARETAFVDVGVIESNLSAPVVALELIEVRTMPSGVTVVGSPGAVSDPDQPVHVTVRNSRTGAGWATTANADGSFLLAVNGEAGDVMVLKARDSHTLPRETEFVAVGSIAFNGGAPVLDPARITLNGSPVVGAPGAVSDPDTPIVVTARNDRTLATWSTTAGADGSFVIGVVGEPGDAISLVARDSHLFPAESARLVIGALTDPGAVEINSTEWTSDPNFKARRVTTNGHALAVTSYPVSSTDGASGTVVLLDLTNPVQPSLLRTHQFPRPVRSVAIGGDWVWFGHEVNSFNNSLAGMRIDDGIMTEAFGAFNGHANALALFEDTLFVAYGRTVHAFDVRAPQSPQRIRAGTNLGAGGQITALIPVDDRYLIAINPLKSGTVREDVVVLDWSAGDVITLVTTLDIPDFDAIDASLSGSTLYLVSDTAAEIVALDLANPAAPAIIGREPLQSPAGGIASIEEDGFVADTTSGLATVDLTDASVPTVRGYTSLSGSAVDVVIAPTHAYVATEIGIAIVPARTAPLIDRARIEVNRDGANATVDGRERSVIGLGPITGTIRNTTRSLVVNGVSIAGDGSFSTLIQAESGDEIILEVIDGGGKSAGPVIVGRVPFGRTVTLDTVSLAVPNHRARALAIEGHDLLVSDTVWPLLGNRSETILHFNLPDPAQPLLERSIEALNGIYSTAIRNGHAYLGELPLSTLDLRDPNASLLTPKSDLGTEAAFAFIGNFMLTSALDFFDGRVRLYDISNPVSPRFVKDQTGFTNGVFSHFIPAAGNLLIGLTPEEWTGNVDIVIFDARDPANLRKLSQLSIAGASPLRGAVQGTYLYLAGIEGKLAVVEFSDPSAPAFRGLVDTPGAKPHAVVAQGGDLWVADDVAGLTRLSLADPAVPVVIGTQALRGAAWDIVSNGNTLFVAHEFGVTAVSDIPLRPEIHAGLVRISGTADARVTGARGALTGTGALSLQLRNITTGNVVAGVAAANGSFVADMPATPGDQLSLQVTDVAGRTTGPLALGRFLGASAIEVSSAMSDAGFGSRAVAREGETLVISDANFPFSPGSDKLLVFNASANDPSYARTVAVANGPIAGMALSGGWAFVADRGLSTVNVGAGAPVFSVPAGPRPESAVAVAGNIAFTGNQDGELRVWNVADPSQPTLVRSYGAIGQLLGRYITQLEPLGTDYLLAFTRQLFFVNQSDRVVILDRRDPNAIVVTATLAAGHLVNPRGAVEGSLLYLINDAGPELIIVDLVNPIAPVIRGRTTLPFSSRRIVVDGTTARLAGGFGGVITVDISNPDAPQVTGNEPVAEFVWDIATTPGSAFVVDGKALRTLQLPPIVTAARISIEALSASLARVSGTAESVAGRKPLQIEISNTVTSAAVVVPVAADGSFEATISGIAGQTLAATATDPASLTSGLVVIGTVPLFVQDLTVRLDRITLGKVGTDARVTGTAGAVTGTMPVSVVLANVDRSTSGAAATVAEDGSFEAFVAASPGESITLSATDASGSAGPFTLGRLPLDPPVSTAITAAMTDAGFRARTLAVDGTKLVVASTPDGGTGESDKLVIFDIANPAAPVHQTTVVAGRGAINDVETADGWAFVASDQLALVNLGDPTQVFFSDASEDVPATAVAIHGTLAFTTHSHGSSDRVRMLVHDVTDRTAPRVIGEGRVSDFGEGNVRVTDLLSLDDGFLVALSPNVTAIGGHDVGLIDIREPNYAYRILRVDIPGLSAYRGALVGRKLHIAGEDGRYAIIDFTDVFNPVVSPVFITVDSARGIDLAGDVAVVAAGTAIEYVDTSTVPSQSTLSTAVSAGWDVALHRGAMYVANETSLLAFADPALPPMIDASRVTLQTSGSNALVAGASGAVRGTLPLTASLHAANGGTAAVVIDASGGFSGSVPALPGETIELRVIDGNSRESRRSVGTVPFGNETATYVTGADEALDDPDYVSRKVAVDGEHLVASGGWTYLANRGSDRILVYSAPSSETPAATYRTAVVAGDNWISDLEVHNGWAFATSNRFAAVDLTQPEPVAVFGTAPSNYQEALAISSPYAFTTVQSGGAGIRVYDINNPAVPIHLGDQILIEGISFRGLTTFGDDRLIAFTNRDSGGIGFDVIVIDRSNINQLQVLKTLDISGFDALDGIVDGTTLYVTGDYYARDGFAIVDLSDLENLRVLSFVDTPGFATGIAISGPDEIAVADSTSGVTFIDVSDKSNPIILGSQRTPGNAVDLVVSGKTIYVATEGQLHAITRP